jgi:hypothetical protein
MKRLKRRKKKKAGGRMIKLLAKVLCKKKHRARKIAFYVR